ncbi:ferredoxin [uncultured Jatrophihabitans sp.]|uniref:ferredoxin n=1 Tax=uncultured Jatrophihabitans sp. TaxID=1610747 RepID=UPI0035CAF04D
MLRISVDQAKCTGHARCNATAPDVYPIDDDGYTALNGVVDVPDDRADAARHGAAACPERAITVLDA